MPPGTLRFIFASLTTLVLMFVSSGLPAQENVSGATSVPVEVRRLVNDAVDDAAVRTTAQHLAQRQLETARQVGADVVSIEATEAEELASDREREALERLAQARVLEERERNEALRELRVRERILAEEALATTRQHSEFIATLRQETKTQLEGLAERKSKLLDALEASPVEPNEATRRDEIDLLFDELLELRSEAHARFRKALSAANDAEARLDERSEEVERARSQLRRAQERQGELDSSQVLDRRVAVARARLNLALQRQLQQREVLDAYRQRVRDFHTQLGFFAGSLEPLLERISDERRAAFFELGQSENWQVAMEGLGTGFRALEERVEHRLEQFDTSDLATLEFWAWLWELLWTLAGLLLVGYVGIRALIWTVERVCSGLLRRRLLRQKVTLLVKLSETLRAISRPTLYYIGIAYVAHYSAQTLPELQGLVWIVDAVFIYWVVMKTARVALLPRSHRRSEGSDPLLRRS